MLRNQGTPAFWLFVFQISLSPSNLIIYILIFSFSFSFSLAIHLLCSPIEPLPLAEGVASDSLTRSPSPTRTPRPLSLSCDDQEEKVADISVNVEEGIVSYLDLLYLYFNFISYQIINVDFLLFAIFIN